MALDKGIDEILTAKDVGTGGPGHERLAGAWSPATAMAEVRARDDGFVWCGRYEPDDEPLREVAETFGLPKKATGHVIRTHHRPKLRRTPASC